MDADATTPPSRARLALAWRVGLRARSPRLVPALICLALAAAIPQRVEPALASALRAAWSGRDGHVLLNMFAGTWPIAVASLGALALAAAAATGSLGWVGGDRARLGRVGATRPGVGAAAVAAAVIVALALAVRGVVAGAARGTLTSEAGLSTLWLEWLRRGLLAIGAVMLVAALIELVLQRGAVHRALHQTRREAEEHGR